MKRPETKKRIFSRLCLFLLFLTVVLYSASIVLWRHETPKLQGNGSPLLLSVFPVVRHAPCSHVRVHEHTKKESSSETATTTKKARGDDFSLFSLLFFRSLTKVTPLVLLVLCISLPLSVMCVCVRARVPFLPFGALRWAGRRRSFFIVISFTTQACCASHSAVASLSLSLSCRSCPSPQAVFLLFVSLFPLAFLCALRLLSVCVPCPAFFYIRHDSLSIR